MKTTPKREFARKTGAATLALFLLTGSAWAAASCVSAPDMRALQIAALQQQLIVAALTCHAAPGYNRFVMSYQSELQESDRVLMRFFLRQDADKGADGYNAYKTRLANTASLRSLHNLQFCSSAKLSFDVALKRNGSLAELVSERPSVIETGYTSCLPGAPEAIQVASAVPDLPARHRALPDTMPSASISPADSMPWPERARPPVSPPRDAGTRETNGRDAAERDDFDRDGTETRSESAADDGAPAFVPRYANTEPPSSADDRRDENYADNTAGDSDYRDSYSRGNDAPDDYYDANNAPSAYVPYAYRPGATWVRDYGPPPRLVRGPDGHWYVLTPYGPRRYYGTR